MDEQTVRKTYTYTYTYKLQPTLTYKLQPTAEQAGAMEFVLRRCRELSNAGLQERRDAWQQCGVSITAASQSAQLPALKPVRPEYRDLHSQVLPRRAHPPGPRLPSLLPPRERGQDTGLSTLC